MKKSISSLVLLSMAFAPAVYGWGTANAGNDVPADQMVSQGANNPAIHLHGDDQIGWLNFSYLLFKPHVDNGAFASLVTNPFGLNGAGASIKPKTPDFNWSSGARVSLGRYLPNHDQWAIGFTTSYYYSNSENEVESRAGSDFTTAYLAPQMFQNVLGNFAQEAEGNWRMNFFVMDLGLSREFFITPEITLTPYLGARGMVLYQKTSSTYSSFFETAGGTLVVPAVNTKMSARQETWGVGLRAASDVAFHMRHHLSIIGSFGGSLLYGHYKNRQNFSGLVQPLLNPYNPRVFNHGYDLVSNIEGNIGLRWERWYEASRNRLAISVTFEGQQWFDINKLTRVDSTSAVATVPGAGAATIFEPNPVGLNGDLTLVGFTFTLAWDF